MPKSVTKSTDYWKFPSLEVRRRRQIWATDVRTGITSAARACRVTNTYYLVRFRKPKKGKVTAEHLHSAGLDAEQIHFVLNNETPAERKRGW